MKLDDVMTVVCKAYGVTPRLIKGPSRERTISHPRAAFCFFARQYTRCSLPQIGRFLNRDHSTILYAERSFPSASRDYGYTAEAQKAADALTALAAAEAPNNNQPALKWVGRGDVSISVAA